MNTVIFVVGAMWLLPIVALLMANLVLSIDQRRALVNLAGDRAVSRQAARTIVTSTPRVRHEPRKAFASVTSESLAVSDEHPYEFQLSLN